MYKVIYSRKVRKFFDKQTEKFIKRFDKTRKILQKNPYQNNLSIKKIKDKKDIYRLRIGEYRILYKISDDVNIILIFDAGHRKNIYR
ncbi:MAG: type II toxin-antitoxin system RelE/ParE family toxin [Candidatus Latescibacteria bacterium]|jgi:mRNA interferase RelE/StbE|nr:type II toxin-antitoxin system RelE/ParE family toxin [Candidatus Latescibacterota bacterium]